MGQDIAQQYNAIGRSYIEIQSAAFSEREKWGRRTIQHLLPDLCGKVIVDIGCGHGPDVKYFLGKGAGRVLGIDPSSIMLAEAQRRIQNDRVEFQRGAYESIPLTGDVADIVIGFYSLHYVTDLSKAYREIYRILRGNGVCFFLVPHPVENTSIKKIGAKKSSQEIIKMPLYDNRITVRYPTHNLSDYFSEYFLEHFILEKFCEFTPKTTGEDILPPTAMVFKGRKRKDVLSKPSTGNKRSQ